MAQGVFKGHGQVFQAANGAMNDLTALYALVPAVVAVPEATVAAYATAETYGIPAAAITTWLLQDSNASNLFKVGNWAYGQCQTYGLCPNP